MGSDVDSNEPSSTVSTPAGAFKTVDKLVNLDNLVTAKIGSPRMRKRNVETKIEQSNALKKTDGTDQSPLKKAKRNSKHDPLIASLSKAMCGKNQSPDKKSTLTNPDKILDDIPISQINPENGHKLGSSLGLTTSESSIIDDLKAKFQELSVLRTTAAETLLAEYKASAETRISAAEKVIEALCKENELLQQSKNSRLTDKERTSDVSMLSKGDDRMRTKTCHLLMNLKGPLIELYRGLSGLNIAMDIDDEKLWHCTLRGRQGEFTFDLTFDEESNQYGYQPTFSSKAPIASRLPAYLQEEIAFDVDQLQLFFWRALNFLMSLSVSAANK